MYIDSHAHLTCKEMLPDVEATLERAQKALVTRILNICTDELSLDAGLALAQKHPWIANGAACTPHDVATSGDPFFARVEQEARAGSLSAIGETGLDYYYTHSPKELQKEHLRRYIALAKETHLPLVIHCRDAFADLFAITAAYLGDHPAILHCFTGTLEEARGVIERGWYLSLSGIVTFKKSEELRQVAAWVPLDRLLIETDCPYLAPQKWRGQRNEPAYISETARIIADIKKISIQEVASQTTKNAARVVKKKFHA